MKKKYIITVIIGVCCGIIAVGSITHAIKNATARGYITACFTNTALSVRSDYADALEKLNIHKMPVSYEIKSDGNTFGTAPTDSAEPTDSDISELKNSATELYDSIKVRKSRSEKIFSGKTETDCTVYTATADRDLLDKCVRELKNTSGYAQFRQTVTNAVHTVADNLGVEVADEDIANVLDLVTPEENSLIGCMTDDLSADIYISDKKVRRIATTLNFADTDLEKVVLELTMGDGEKLLNRADIHLGITVDGKTMYFDAVGSGNLSGDTDPLAVKLKSAVTFDHLNLFELSLTLDGTSQTDGLSAVGYYAVSGKRTSIDGNGIIYVGDETTFAYYNSKGENTLTIFAK